MMMALYATLLAQAWNMLGGFGGQFSFGHALFFGSGAYVQAMAQLHGGMNPWLALPLAIASAALVGLGVGALAFRYGLKGSYFALDHAGLCRGLPHPRAVAALHRRRRRADAAAAHGGVEPAVRVAARLRAAGAGLRRAGAVCVTAWLRHSRFGARLQAVRDNEDAARALGIDPLRTKLAACVLSGAFMGAAGAFYVQVFHYIDPAIAFGPTTSVEALLGAIVGGMGTLWGPVLGALALHLLSDLTRNLFGALPGINMVIYGVVLVLIVMFMPRGIAGIGQSVRALWQGGRRG